MKEIVVIAKNEVGTVARIAEALGSVGVNIEAISAYGSDGKGILRLLTNDVFSAVKVLSKVPNIEIRESEIILYQMSNKPGELGRITRKLANNGIDLETLYIVSRRKDSTEVAIKPAHEAYSKALEILKANE